MKVLRIFCILSTPKVGPEPRRLPLLSHNWDWWCDTWAARKEGQSRQILGVDDTSVTI